MMEEGVHIQKCIHRTVHNCVIVYGCVSVLLSECVCVCVCMREREREREFNCPKPSTCLDGCPSRHGLAQKNGLKRLSNLMDFVAKLQPLTAEMCS